MNKTREKIKGKVKENVSLMSTPLMSILPGQISFFVILSLIPFVSVMLMLITKLSISFEGVTLFITHYIPKGFADVILSFLESQKVGALDIVFIVTAIYIASKATHSIIIASTEIYGGRQRNFFRTRIKAIIMLIILVLLVLAVLLILTIGSRILWYIKETNGNIHPYVYTIYQIIKWPFVFFMIFFTVKVIYTLAPNVPIPSSSVNKGALMTTSVWVITTYVFSFYVTNIANYSKLYGNLSNLIILMIWIYWICYIFVLGMTMNKYKFGNKQEQ